MKFNFATGGFVIATLLAAVAAHADNADLDPVHRLTFVKYSEISTKVKAKLAGENARGLAHIKVDTDNKGAVLLSGEVRSRKEAEQAASIARATDGVTSVTSIIQIKREMLRIMV